ncbi:MAG: response regulator transcription factor [Pseudomonadota bacterium]|nr:response regulator transcription factor [Pseudomonadota bacterium]
MIENLPHILVVDDDARLCKLLCRFLADNGFVVMTAETAENARAKLRGLAFDLIVLDIMMPGESGLDLTRSLRDTRNVPILLLTACGDPEDRISGLEAGADDYLTKPFEPRELLLRIRSILRRAVAAPEPTGQKRIGSWMWHPETGELKGPNGDAALTNIEASLLTALAETPGKILTRENLSEKSRIKGGARAVDVQITRLRRKLDDDPRNPRMLQTVRGIGYVLKT